MSRHSFAHIALRKNVDRRVGVFLLQKIIWKLHECHRLEVTSAYCVQGISNRDVMCLAYKEDSTVVSWLGFIKKNCRLSNSIGGGVLETWPINKKKLQVIYGTRRFTVPEIFIYAQQWTILSQINPIYTFTPCFFKSNFKLCQDIYFHPRLDLPMSLFPSDFGLKFQKFSYFYWIIFISL